MSKRKGKRSPINRGAMRRAQRETSVVMQSVPELPFEPMREVEIKQGMPHFPGARGWILAIYHEAEMRVATVMLKKNRARITLPCYQLAPMAGMLGE